MKQGHLLDHIFKLAHIAGPAIGHEQLTGRVVKRDARHGVTLGKICCKLTREQQYVTSAVAQRGNGDRDGRKAVVKVFAKTTFGHSPSHVDIGGRHDTHIGTLHCR